jgi:barstar (barnase inhibitor)
MSTDKNANSGVVKISSGSVPAIIEEARKTGAAVYKLPSDAVTSKAEFFEAVRRTLPLDPPLVGSRLVWDALSDSLSGGLANLGSDRVFIIWPDSALLEAEAPADFETAVSIFRHIVATRKNQAYSRGQPKDIRVFLA